MLIIKRLFFKFQILFKTILKGIKQKQRKFPKAFLVKDIY